MGHLQIETRVQFVFRSSPTSLPPRPPRENSYFTSTSFCHQSGPLSSPPSHESFCVPTSNSLAKLTCANMIRCSCYLPSGTSFEQGLSKNRAEPKNNHTESFRSLGTRQQRHAEGRKAPHSASATSSRERASPPCQSPLPPHGHHLWLDSAQPVPPTTNTRHPRWSPSLPSLQPEPSHHQSREDFSLT